MLAQPRRIEDQQGETRNSWAFRLPAAEAADLLKPFQPPNRLQGATEPVFVHEVGG